ncbi:hypothetical protein [Methylobacterium durans]|uniref:Uncharacterized protein n=1 Tax=Methylobacterium durans TaxID=2202825 RepID=A0A2U8WD37_9HYPH|nr:hypothetical protein [Methylobacterium durans]AWN43182.1 hypothetical protein DK389_25145 [Methylobacterium durans]
MLAAGLALLGFGLVLLILGAMLSERGQTEGERRAGHVVIWAALALIVSALCLAGLSLLGGFDG